MAINDSFGNSLAKFPSRSTFLKASTLLVGAFFLAVPQAQAGGGSHLQGVGGGHRGNGFKQQFREFRQQNPDFNKREQKMMFRQQILQNNPPGNMHILPYPYPWCPVPLPYYPGGRLAKGLDLDLTSELQNITLSKDLFSNTQDSVDIRVGGATRTLQAGDQVTAAEYVAARQKLAGLDQSVHIDGSGIATGGDVDLGALTEGNDVLRVNSLVVSDNVTASGDFGKRSDFRLFGDLENYGTVHALSSDKSVKGGTIRALNISNYEGAEISSDVNLNLHADWNLYNEGSITSNGTLTITAGQGVDNSGKISANKELTINSNWIGNQGTIESKTADVNINASGFPAYLEPIYPPPYILIADDAGNVVCTTAPEGGISSILPGGCVVYLDDVNVDNEGGEIKAENGAINVRSSDYQGFGNTTITGGNLLSKELNLNSGNGAITVDVEQITGVINETGTAAHVSAATADLNIGKVCLTGDPTFYNSAGNIHINAPLTVSELLVIAASGNITSADGITIEASNGSQGFAITMIAGAAITPAAGPGGSDTVPPGTVGAISLSGKASSTGGSILLGDNVDVIASFTGSPSNEPGANIELFAFAGKAAGTGVVDVSGARLETRGFGTGANGDVRIAAGARDTTAVLIGEVNTAGGAAATGDLIIITAQPTTSDKSQTINYDATGVNTGAFLVPSTKPSKGAHVEFVETGVGTEVNLEGDGIVNASGEIYVQGNLQTATNFFLTAGGDITAGGLNPPIIAGVGIDLEAGGNIGQSAGDRVRVNTPFLDATADGDVNFVEIVGATNTLVEDFGARETADLLAPTVLVDMDPFGGFFARNEIKVDSLKLGPTFGFSGARDTITIINRSTTGAPFGGGFGFFKTFNLQDNAGIGTSADPFEVERIGTVNLNSAAGGGAVFVDDVGKQGALFNVLADTNSRIENTGGGGLTLGDVNIANGNFEARTAGRTITVAGDVAANTGIIIDNDGTKGSSKIVFGLDSSVSTNNKTTFGDITISVGGPGTPADNPGPFPNVNIVETGGTVTVNGPGFKAKEPINTITAQGANVLINNGLNAGNISFEGNVAILADPPVSAGTPTFVTEGPVVLYGQNSGATTFGAGNSSPNSVSSDAGAQVTNQQFSLNADYQSSLSNLLTVNTLKQTSLDALTLSTMADDSFMVVSKPAKYSHDAAVYTDLDLGHGVGAPVSSTKNSVSGSGTSTMPIRDSMNHASGIALYVPSKDMTVSTPSGSVKLNAGSMALVSAGRDHLSVYNLHDEKSGGVIVETAGRSISLLPGRHACIASEKANAFSDVNPIEAVPHRSVSRKDLGNGQTVFQSEFSLLSAAEAIKPLKSILTSKHAGAKKVAQRMLKTTAVVMHLSGATPYEFHVKPRTVALRQNLIR